MQVFQIMHIKYSLDKKTHEPCFNKGLFIQKRGPNQFEGPIRFFKNGKDVEKFLKCEQKSILNWNKWNKKRVLVTNKLTKTSLMVEFEPNGNGMPCEAYFAVKVNVPDKFIAEFCFKDF